MNRRSCLVGVIVLAILIVPLTQTDMELSTTQVQNESNPGIPEGIPEELKLQNGSEHTDDVALDMMHFTETSSKKHGLYYVCRRGVDPVAYFGKSTVKYLSGDTVFTLEFPGSNSVEPVGEKPTGSVTNYFLGSDAAQWKTGLSDYSMLRYPEIYPGIDLVYKMSEGSLKYEFVVSPHVDPSCIELQYTDAEIVTITRTNLTIIKNENKLIDANLKAFQRNSGKSLVDCRFVRSANNRVTFSLGSYDSSAELVIDPVCLPYSTFVGGSNSDRGFDIAVENGSMYITGDTDSPDFPAVNAYDSTLEGSVYDCFVTKLAYDGQSLIYSTFLGGSGEDAGRGIAVENGAVYVTGETSSSDFPTINPLNSTFGGDRDCFVTKLAIDGQSLAYSTFIGGTDYDWGWSIAVENGSAYITGGTKSTDFPTHNAHTSSYSGGYNDCFVCRLGSDGQSLVFSTYLGGSDYDRGNGIAAEGGNAYVIGKTLSSDFPTVSAYQSGFGGGRDCFVTKFGSEGKTLSYSTYIGGSNWDRGRAIAVENGSAYVTGYTDSSDFPIINALDETYDGNEEAFVTKIGTSGHSLDYSTYIGGSGDDWAESIAIENGSAYVTGRTASMDFPVLNAYNSTSSGTADCFVTQIGFDGQSLVYSTYFGGSDGDYGTGIAVENGYTYITGYTYSDNFPTISAYDSSRSDVGADCIVSVFTLSNDTDTDGLLDGEERFQYGTDPTDSDSDNDGLQDGSEINTYGTDPLDGDSDNDGLSDGAEVNTYDTDPNKKDTDDDGLSDEAEINTYGTNPNDADTDDDDLDDGSEVNDYSTDPNDSDSENDGMPDGWEVGNGLDPLVDDASEDSDADNLSNVDEYLNGTDPNDSDSENDEMPDGWEINNGLNPLSDDASGDKDEDGLCNLEEYQQSTNASDADTDSDGLEDGPEVHTYGTNPNSADTESDGLSDGAEINIYDTDALDSDTDCDGLEDGTEVYSYSTDPHLVDTDNDNFLDGYEITYGSNATNANDYPAMPQQWYDEIYEDLDGNATLIQNLIEWSDGNATLLENVKLQLEDNATLLQQVISWLDGNHTAIENLYTYLEGNATLLSQTVDNLESNASLIENLVTWSEGNETLLLNVIDQLESNATLLQQTITWLDGNHTAVETLFTYMEGNATRLDQTIAALEGNATRLEQVAQWLDGNHTAIESLFDYVEGNATLLEQTVSWLENNHTAIESLFTCMDGNSTLLEQTISDLEGNATRLQQLAEWLDGNHTEIETLYNHLQGNATLLEETVTALDENATLIQNLVSWSEGNSTLLESVIQQLDSNATLLRQTISWLDGNHTAIETLFCYMEGNATLLQETVTALDGNATQLDVVAALATDNHQRLQELNSTAIGNITEIREVLGQLGVTVGDADYDGLDDLTELEYGTDTQCIDTDCDNLNDAYEVKIGTDPLDDDTDQDGYFDGAEVLSGTDPLNASDYPGVTDSTTTTGDTSTTTVSDPPGGIPFIIVLVLGTGVGAGVIVVVLYILRRQRRGS